MADAPKIPGLHDAVSRGFQAGAAIYERGRPDYPGEIDAWLRNVLHVGPGKRVLDLGAGTGKFTRHLLATGANVIAVEPVAAMRERLLATHPFLTVLRGQAEAIAVPDHTLDAVVCAQAFHWFGTAQTLTEITRVLRTGGSLGLVWNVRDNTVPWVAKVQRIMLPYEKDAPRFDSDLWRKPFPFPGLTQLVEHRFPHKHTGPAERVIVDRVLSTSFIACLPEAERERVAAQVRDVIAREPQLVGREEVSFPYVTYAYAAEKR